MNLSILRRYTEQEVGRSLYFGEFLLKCPQMIPNWKQVRETLSATAPQVGRESKFDDHFEESRWKKWVRGIFLVLMFNKESCWFWIMSNQTRLRFGKRLQLHITDVTFVFLLFIRTFHKCDYTHITVRRLHTWLLHTRTCKYALAKRKRAEVGCSEWNEMSE